MIKIGPPSRWGVKYACYRQENRRKPDVCGAPPCLSGQGGLSGGGNFWLGS